MVKLSPDKPKVTNDKYNVKWKSDEWSPVENHFTQLIKKKSDSETQTAWYVHNVCLSKKVARYGKSIFIFILCTFLETVPWFSEYLLKLGNILRMLTKSEIQLPFLWTIRISRDD